MLLDTTGCVFHIIMYRIDKIVGARDLSVSYAKPLLESEADIDAYLESYKQALVNTVKQGKKVRL